MTYANMYVGKILLWNPKRLLRKREKILGNTFRVPNIIPTIVNRSAKRSIDRMESKACKDLIYVSSTTTKTNLYRKRLLMSIIVWTNGRCALQLYCSESRHADLQGGPKK